MKSKDTRPYFFILAIIAILSRTWVTEDAYITFKHIDNFIAGNGLVFNQGESVEGFTHPVWALLILGLRLIGIPNHLGSILLGYFFSLAGLYLLLKFAGKSAILLAVAVILSNQGFVDFSTAGMETSLTFFLISHLFYEIVPANFKSPAKVSLILSLLYLNRPEFGILLFYYGIYTIYLSFKAKNLQQIIDFVVPVILFAGGYHLFRWFYYQDIFPNTYYAKSGGAASYIQGLKYILHFTLYSYLFIPYILFWFYTFIKKKSMRRNDLRRLARDLGALFLMVFYIVRVGGDFMAFRLLLPSFYFFVILTGYYMQKWWLHELPAIKVFKFNLALLLIVFITRFGAKEAPLVKLGVVNERMAYTMGLNQGFVSRLNEIKYHWFGEGKAMGDLQKCLEYKPFVITNSITEAKCSPGVGLGYFAVAAGTDVNVIDELGLTDKKIARQQRISQFRVGHERSVGLDYLIERGTLFCSLGNEDYDAVMGTDYGVIINLSPEFLYRLGNQMYQEKVNGLKKIYLQNKNSNTEKGQKLMGYLQALAKKYSIKILELPPVIPQNYEKYSKCWKKPAKSY